MTKSRLFLVLTSLVIVAFLVCGQQALAAENHHHWQVKVIPRTHSADAVHPNTVIAGLYATEAAFVATDLPTTNTDGSDLWPCFGDTSSANPDCPTIGAPSVTFPTGGVALGAPSYTWSLSACNGTTNGNVLCGQTNSWYEDDSGDSTDDLTYEIEVTQGENIIADSGLVDFGPNTFGGLSPAANVIIYGDQNFGTLGETGKNNGNCDADFNYPSPELPGVFVIAAGKTCVDPVAGPVKFTATTSVQTATFTTSAKGVTTVKYKLKYKVKQTWTITLQ